MAPLQWVSSVRPDFQSWAGQWCNAAINNNPTIAASHRLVKKLHIASMTISASASMTLEEYLEYEPETDGHYELRNGQLVDMNAESDVNVSIAMFLIAILLHVVPYRDCGTRSEVETRYPDLLVLTPAGVAALAGKGRSLASLT